MQFNPLLAKVSFKGTVHSGKHPCACVSRMEPNIYFLVIGKYFILILECFPFLYGGRGVNVASTTAYIKRDLKK